MDPLFIFSTDPTQLKEEISDIREVLKTREAKQYLVAQYNSRLEIKENIYTSILQEILSPEQIYEAIGGYIDSFIKTLFEKPYFINQYQVAGLESLYLLNLTFNENVSELDIKRSNERFSRLHKKAFSTRESILHLIPMDGEFNEELDKEFKTKLLEQIIMDYDTGAKPDSFLFECKLRYVPITEIDDFLNYHSKKIGYDFIEYLEAIILKEEYSHLANNTKIMAKKWLEKNKLIQNDGTLNFPNHKFLQFSDRKVLNLSYTPSEIRRFLSCLGSTDLIGLDTPLLQKNDLETLMAEGLSYSLKKGSSTINKIKINQSNHPRRKRILGFLFYKLYNLNSDTVTKTEMIDFLTARFEIFSNHDFNKMKSIVRGIHKEQYLRNIPLEQFLQ